MISRDGELFLQDKRIDNKDLEKALRRVIMDTGEDILVLKVDKYVPYGDVVDVMDVARGAGFRKVIAPTIMKNEAVQ